MGSNDWVQFKLEGISELLNIENLIFKDLPIENFEDLDLPKKLPNLKSLKIYDCPLKSLKGLPSEMPNLDSIYLSNLRNIKNLNGFPGFLPNFWIFGINNLPELRSLEGLPPDMPKLSSIRLRNLPKLHSFKGISPLPRYRLKIEETTIQTFRHLPENIWGLSIWNYKQKNPCIFDLKLKKSIELGFTLQNCIIKDFSFLSNYTIDDFKKYGGFVFERCLIHSFEGLPVFPNTINPKDIFYMLDEDYNYEVCKLEFGNSTIRSLSGLSLPILKYLLPFFIYNEKFEFATTGRKLYEDCINRSSFQKENWSVESFTEIANCKNPNHIDTLTKYNVDLAEMERFNLTSLVDWKIHKQKQYWETKEQWFHPDKIKLLYEYFKTPIVELAHQYIAHPSEMPPAQIERLIHEADHNIRKILENSLPPKDPTILKISQKIAYTAPNGFKILK